MSKFFPDSDHKSIRKMLLRCKDGGQSLLVDLLSQTTQEDELESALQEHLDLVKKLRQAKLEKAAAEAARAITDTGDFAAAETILGKAAGDDSEAVRAEVAKLRRLNSKIQAELEALDDMDKEPRTYPLGAPQLYHLW